MHRLIVRVFAAIGAFALLAVVAAPAATAANSRQLIVGSGSGWSANAVNQWIADVKSNGIKVVFSASGSAQGRKDFAYKTSDFAVTEIGYQGVDVFGNRDDSLGRPFAYLPIVAGGTSFPYQIKVQGEQIKDLRLSGDTLTKIFTNRITNWNDPAITRDNNGRKLPSLPIIPVLHSEGSGSSAQFTRYMDTMYPSLWRSYLGRAGLTEYFPRKGQQIAQNGSDGVMNFITAKSSNGSIGYAEYSYALGKDYPVVKLRNKAGFYNLPTKFNVAVALTKAQINYKKNDPTCPVGPANCYLLQNLDKVYVATDPRAYPMSSYSYMVIPTGKYGPNQPETKVNTAKRQTIADFLYYSICQGQKEVGPIGYSPLPINLVQAGFKQLEQLKAADPAVDLSKRNVATCNNPTFIAGQPNRNYLAEVAPKPPSCDKEGAGPCDENGTPAKGSNASNASTTSGSGTSGSGTGSTGDGTGTTSGGAGTTGTGSGGAVVDPLTGALVSNGSLDVEVVGTATELAGYRSAGLTKVLAPLAAILLLVLLIAPPLVARAVKGRRPAGGGSS